MMLGETPAALASDRVLYAVPRPGCSMIRRMRSGSRRLYGILNVSPCVSPSVTFRLLMLTTIAKLRRTV